MWNEKQEPGSGFPEHDITELVNADYLEKFKSGRRLTLKGHRIATEHVNPRTRHKFLRYVIFDEFRRARHAKPDASIASKFDDDDFADWGVDRDQVERAQRELAAVGLLELDAMNTSHANSYKLTAFGKRACAQDRLIEAAIEGNEQAVASGTTQHFNISNVQGQVNAGHTVNVDQGDLVFGAGVPNAQQDKLTELIRDLRADIANKVNPEAEREDAETAVSRVASELGKSPPDQSRLRRWVELLGDVAKPYAGVLALVTALISLLRAMNLIP